jgi:broad specificity phosphatase PhoE
MADPSEPVGPGAPLALPPDLVATLVLVRHGESTFVAEGRFQGRQDPPLSELGVRQAALVAKRLAHRDERTPLPLPEGPPLAIWHSPLRRAAETARLIGEEQHRDFALRAEDRLTEIAQGEWEGKLLSEVRSRWARELAAWRQTPAQNHAPGGESLKEAADRVRGGLQQIVAALPRLTPTGYVYDPVPGYVPAPRESARGEPIANRARDATDERAPRARAGGGAEPWAVVVAHDGIFRLALMSLLGIAIERFWSLPFVLTGITVVTLHEGVAALRAHNLSDHLEPLAIEERAAQESRGERRGAL